MLFFKRKKRPGAAKAKKAPRKKKVKAQKKKERDKEKPQHPLTVSNPLSAGDMIAPPAMDVEEIYLPIVFRGE